jgi:hypothetical protein
MTRLQPRYIRLCRAEINPCRTESTLVYQSKQPQSLADIQATKTQAQIKNKLPYLSSII